MRILRLLAMGSAALLPAVLPEATATTPDELLAAGRYAEAERLLEQRLEAGRFEGTVEPLKRLAAARPEVARYRYLLGFSLLGRFRYAEAEVELRRAVEADPAQHAWLHALAKALLEQGRNRAAIEFLDRAIALRPDPEYRFAKAMCLLNAGEPERAEQELRLCLRTQPGNADVLYELGRIVADRGDDRDSLELFRRCLEANPGHLEARFRLGLAESKVGDPARAAAQFEAVLAEIPGHVGALYNLGRTLIRLGRVEEGRLRLERFRTMSVLEDRIQFRRESVRLQPADVERRADLARLLLEAGRLDDALSQLLAARNLEPRRAEIYRLLAVVFERMGREEDRRRADAFADELEGSTR